MRNLCGELMGIGLLRERFAGPCMRDCATPLEPFGFLADNALADGHWTAGRGRGGPRIIVPFENCTSILRGISISFGESWIIPRIMGRRGRGKARQSDHPNHSHKLWRHLAGLPPSPPLDDSRNDMLIPRRIDIIIKGKQQNFVSMRSS